MHHSGTVDGNIVTSCAGSLGNAVSSGALSGLSLATLISGHPGWIHPIHACGADSDSR